MRKDHFLTFYRLNYGAKFLYDALYSFSLMQGNLEPTESEEKSLDILSQMLINLANTTDEIIFRDE